ncbi:MAG: energy-coupling factor ABC transporter ATP-binding protein [Deferribacteraceae bacterium]|jgi:cobalt/nickel transport system ATP-binding protein|nr:energy-coupling factor ABC transporter ATP-binding protein [Deferribacteraceae bacterium]
MLDVKDLTHKYGDISSIKGISFAMKQGESICVAGANGSGKSTLLQLIATSLKPLSGDILLHGCSIYSDLVASRRKIGLVFQNPDDQLFMPAVWEDVAYGVLSKGMQISEAKDLALHALSKVNAEHLAERMPHRLSGGEKYRVAIATVLILEPELLILDEPTASLDPKARKNIIKLLAELECSKIIATHDLSMAKEICNRVIFLNHGQIAADAANLLTDEHFLHSIGLELP